MITANELRRGVSFELEGELYRVVAYSHSYIGRGSATVRLRIRNLRTGATLDRTFSPQEKVEEVRLELRPVQYLYNDGELYYFMDTETYDQPVLSREALEQAVNYLKDGQELQLSFHEGKPIEVMMPTTVNLKVIQAEPSFRGDTATAATKSITLETGLSIRSPLFIQVGDTVRVDTRTGEYVTRV